jgi:predicted transcriptional regulator
MQALKKEKLKPPMLGRREIQTLDLFWQQEDASLTAQNIRDLLESGQNSSIKLISLNTIQSTIERLWRKGLLTRSKIGKAYIYASRYSKQEVISSLLSEIRDEMGQGDELIMLSGIMVYLNNWNSELGSRVCALFSEHTDIDKLAD